jgi:hypothetical protein
MGSERRRPCAAGMRPLVLRCHRLDRHFGCRYSIVKLAGNDTPESWRLRYHNICSTRHRSPETKPTIAVNRLHGNVSQYLNVCRVHAETANVQDKDKISRCKHSASIHSTSCFLKPIFKTYTSNTISTYSADHEPEVQFIVA